MMSLLEPKFRRGPHGGLALDDSKEVTFIKSQNRAQDGIPCKSATIVRNKAEALVKRAGGDVNNSKHLLGCFEIQFGCFKGLTFKWILENSPGYAGYLIARMENDTVMPTDYRWVNKMAFKKYVEMWPEGREIIEKKKKAMPSLKYKVTTQSEMSDSDLLLAAEEFELSQNITSDQPTQDVVEEPKQDLPSISSRDFLSPTIATKRKALLFGAKKPLPAVVKRTKSVAKPSNIPSVAQSTSKSAAQSTPNTEAQSTPITAAQPTAKSAVQSMSKSSTPSAAPSSNIQSVPSTEHIQEVEGLVSSSQIPAISAGVVDNQQANEDLCLPARWKKTLPKADQHWISKALFRWTATGGVELVPEHLTKLWWYPPPPAVAVNSVPGVNRYFARPLFLWMPRKQWKVRLHCPWPECEKRELASSGINQKVRQVTDIDGFYNMACDQLDCRNCRRRILSWSHAILSQLDIGHRLQFPCILTAKLACDIKVVRLLRNRGFGNSCSQIQKKIEEQHGEKWLENVLHYLTDCSGFESAAASSLLVSQSFPEPPKRAPVPKHKWLMQIYIQDVLLRLDEIKAGITSVFGRILKIDSTKKIVKKLAGRPAKTSLWCTNVGNEHGQVLISVMTGGEGHGLTEMLVGIINRYIKAQVPPPILLYVDRDCCGASPLKQVLAASRWNTTLRLDVWHFMRRIAAGCTTDSHENYSKFMGYLSNCIFEWDELDLNRLIESKRNELASQFIVIKEDKQVMAHLTKYELTTHCRRKTRDVEQITTLINNLLINYSGVKGRDTIGVPLINTSRMNSIWKAQQKHITCLQDPPGVPLYIRIGSTKKGGIELPNYKCARGSTSLECFHLHLNKFIPGTQANDVLFQAYIMDGLHRWNQDRERAATTTTDDHMSYSGLLRHTANDLGLKVLKRKICPSYKEPTKYTGELIGIEYLYNQTGKVMKDYMQAIDTLETNETVIEDEEDAEDDDGLLHEPYQLDDLTVSTSGINGIEVPYKEDTVLETTEVPPTPACAKQSSEPILSIPTSQTYESWMNDNIFSQMAQPITSVHSLGFQQQSIEDSIEAPLPVVQEKPIEEPIEAPLPVVQEKPIEAPPPVVQEKPIEETFEAPPPDMEEIPSSQPSKSLDVHLEDLDESVGPDNIPGYDKCQELADYLVNLRKNLFMTNAQVNHLILLWNNLYEYDKAPTVFPERFTKEDKGRYKAKKTVRRNVVPGVESTERIMRGGPGAVPASWPSANRYTEAIIRRLLSVLPCKRTRQDDVVRNYYAIRELVLQNGTAMSMTKIQLPEISRSTFIQWYTTHIKGLGKKVVHQGDRFQEPPKSTSVGIPPSIDKPAALHYGAGEDFTFVNPVSTAGLARFRGQKRDSSRRLVGTTRATPATPPQPTVSSNSSMPPTLSTSSDTPVTTPPTSSTPQQLSTINIDGQLYQLTLSTDSVPHTPITTSTDRSCTTALPSSTPQQLASIKMDQQLYQLIPTQNDMSADPSIVPYTTLRYRARKMQKEMEGEVKRKYQRKRPIMCKLCGQERTGLHHRQFFFNWYCGIAQKDISFDDWKQQLEERNYGKKKNKK